MTPREAAAEIGCGVRHVRTLIQRGQIKARTVRLPWGGYTYSIPSVEVRRYAAKPQTVGRPRGVPNQKER